MSSIQTGQAALNFCRSTRVCGNCRHEERKPIVGTQFKERLCGKHGWFVLMSSTCDSHGYRDPAVRNQEGATHAAR